MDSGALFIYSLNADASIKSTTLFSAKHDRSTRLGALDNFGVSLAGVGDIDGDGVPDVAVGAHKYDDPASGRKNVGCVYLCFLSSKGMPKRCDRLAPAKEGAFSTSYPVLRTNDYFGVSLARLGDADGDGVSELLVGASGDDDGGSRSGAAYALFFTKDATVTKFHKVGARDAALGLRAGDHFGASVAADGRKVAVGADSARNSARDGAGAVLLLTFGANYELESASRVDSVTGGGPPLDANDRFGSSVASFGDGLFVGARYDDDAGFDGGAVYRLAVADASCPPPVDDPETPYEPRDGSGAPPSEPDAANVVLAIAGVGLAAVVAVVCVNRRSAAARAARGRAQQSRGSTSCAMESPAGAVELGRVRDDDASATLV